MDSEFVYVVVMDTSGAHEPESSWSVWTTQDAALAEATRMNRVYKICAWNAPYSARDDGPWVAGAMDRA
jgi:hypothetical protein